MAANSAAARQFKKPVYYKTGDNVWGMATADFNHDGKLDLAFAEFFTGQVGIMLGNGNGAFQSPRYFSVPGALQLAVGDFNGDNILDLAVVEYGGTGHSALGVFLGDGKGNFKESATYELGVESTSLVAADFDGDGYLDIAVTNRFGYGNNGHEGAVLMFYGKGDGTFRKPDVYRLPGEPYGIAAGDFNGDHQVDLAVAEDSGGSVAILMNNGQGKFKHIVTYPTDAEADYIAVADLGHRGVLDLVVSNAAGDVAILLGNGDGTFGGATLYSTALLGEGPVGVAIADFRGNGNLDVAVVLDNGYPGLFYGNGDGSFQPVVRITGLDYPGNALAAGVFGKDNEPDLVVGAISKGIAILINAQ